MKLYLAAMFLFLTLVPPNKNVQRKVISDSEYNYTFYVLIEKTPANKVAKFYHWFKSGEIHYSQGASAGNLLHGSYTKSYKDNDLAEQGNFKKGLKDDIWKSWYKNGQLYEISWWQNGLKSGKYTQFSEEGKAVIQGSYKNGRKHGQWIDRSSKDTLYFKNGETIAKPKKYSKKPLAQRTKLFFKNIFSKKEQDSMQPNPKLKQNKTEADKDVKTKKKKVRKKKKQKQNRVKKEK